MKRLLTVIITIFFASVSTLLADSKIVFTKTSHDFGTIQEKDGDVTVTFEFTNEGDTPLLVTRATASCGCTTPTHPKKPLRPGEKGEISVTYHPKGRPGPFDKSIYVFSNDPKEERAMLVITGNVISSTGLRESYTEELGAGLRLKTLVLNFFDVYPGRANRTRNLAFYNEGTTPMSLSFRNVPAHLQVTCEPEVVQPKAEGRVVVTYLADKVRDWGPKNDLFDIFVRGMETRMQNNHITVMADVWEDFSSLTREQRNDAPKIDVQTTQIDFGHCAERRSQEIVIRNTGRQRMQIRKVHNEDPQTLATHLDKATLEPGEATRLRITYDPARTDRRSINQHITIISNDPSNSRVIVTIKASK